MFSAFRRFSSGRIVCNMDAQEENIWVATSELGCCGRPLSSESAILPLSRDIIIPESLSADGDLKQAERQRPSSETCSAQKGTKRWELLLRSALTMTGDALKNKAVVVLNITGYIEDAACAVPWCGTFGDQGSSLGSDSSVCGCLSRGAGDATSGYAA